MKITYETIFERIEHDALVHLGGCSPNLIGSYISGYEDGRHNYDIGYPGGRLTRRQFGDWFSKKVHSGPHGCASICLLNTDTEEEALQLFFEFRKMALKEFTNEQPEEPFEKSDGEARSLKGIILHETMRTKTVMYFGNDDWLRSMWAYCSGYLWAEQDLGKIDSDDRKTFTEFQKWLDKRYPFAEGKNWGKLFTFLGLGSNQQAREEFYDVFELFLEGGEPDAQTKRITDWVQACLADLKERKAKGEL